jgi:2-amino-4-hydroxy-6-hydroxymethyldihydropteridine diphosphokinase
MAQVYISIGSNIDPHEHVRAGVAALRADYGKLQLSSVYESAAVGFAGDNFLNLVAGFRTEDDVQRVASALREIEDRFGRDRSGPKFSSRTLDLDLLLYDDLVLNEAGLDVPREEITKNAFVLWPLAELAPGLRHPRLGITMKELWDAFDKDIQELTPIPFKW